jgi:purine-nucleoside phosphorylase
VKNNFYERVEKAVKSIKSRISSSPQTGVILGSGLNEFVDTIRGTEIPYSKIREFPQSGTIGHRGMLKSGSDVMIFAGRIHYYESGDMDDVVLPVFLFHALGGRNLIITNAAGGINPVFAPGDFVLIKDHINLMGTTPLQGINDETKGSRFPDMKNAYDIGLMTIAKKQSVCEVKEGIYAAVHGPCYETYAEARMLQMFGADMVGMSTVPEVIAARYLGIKVLGVSCISNMVGTSGGTVTHQEVIETGKRVSTSFSALISHILAGIKSNSG